MNHQMIVVKLQPLWMLLSRGNTRVYLGARTVWADDLRYRLYWPTTASSATTVAL